MTTKTKVAFRITGEAITELAQAFVIEGDVRQAEQFLANAAMGITHEQIVAVLLGNAKITGDSAEDNLDIADDDCAEHKKLLNLIYAGIVKYKRKYFKPYAIVDNWGPRDLSSGVKCGRISLQKQKTLYDRNCTYMNNPLSDEVAYVFTGEQKQVVLWGQVQTPPVWIDVVENGDWQKSVDAYLASGNWLETRGHTQYFSDQEATLGYTYKYSTKNKPPAQVTEAKVEPIVLTAVPTAELKTKTNGYILADGRFFACKYFEHKELAKAILQQIYKLEITDPEKQADDLNMLGIHSSMLGGYNCFVKRKPTGKQKDTFLMWCMYHDEDPKQLMNWYHDDV